MDHYIDIEVLPDPEFMPTVLMNALYSKLHRALVQLESTDIGLSFPDYLEDKQRLGKRMRLHGDVRRLQALMDKDWLIGMHDHIGVGDVLKVPDTVRYLAVRRVQTKSSAERLRRRQIRRHGFTAEEALERIPDTVEKHLRLPFVTLKSQSTEQIFRLFIHQRQTDCSLQGSFNFYGLSGEATVPSF